jgi:hypothetical protein
MGESFYTGDGSGQVKVRDGIVRRSLDLRRDPDGQIPNGRTKAASLSYALLADVLRNDARALQLHNRFDQRVVTILPSRWTLTRSRILAYVNTIEMDEHVQPNITSWS